MRTWASRLSWPPSLSRRSTPHAGCVTARWSVYFPGDASFRGSCARLDLRNHVLYAGVGSYVGAPVCLHTSASSVRLALERGSLHRRGHREKESCRAPRQQVDVISLQLLRNSRVARRSIPVISPTVPFVLRLIANWGCNGL